MIHRNADMRVSIVVVNWNGERLLNHCLTALSNQTYPDCEIILVDNGSSDGSVSLVKANFPAVKIVELAENKGFTGGNAAGVNAASGEFIALVNNDARAERDWLERLFQPMLADPGIGSCASKLIIEGTDAIDSAGDGLTSAGVGFNRGHWDDCTKYCTLEPVFAACAAAALYRREMLDEIGFLDSDFFLYDEDTDLSFRAQLAGWKCVYVPSAVAYHKGNATSGRLSNTHVYYHTRNSEWVWLKNMPAGLMLRFAHHKIIQEIGSFCYICLRHGKWSAFFRAKRDAVRKAPDMWRKRKAIQMRRRVPNYYIRALLSPMFTVNFLKRKLKQLVTG
jgi:GT2 family glycosyltransferase